MTSFEISRDLLPASVVEHLNASEVEGGLDKLLAHVLAGCREIATSLRNNNYSTEAVGTQNAFGDNQLDVDVKTDAVLFGFLTAR